MRIILKFSFYQSIFFGNGIALKKRRATHLCRTSEIIQIWLIVFSRLLPQSYSAD